MQQHTHTFSEQPKKYYHMMLLGIAMTTAILVANILAAKQLQFGPFTLPAGTLCFPFVFALANIIIEVYGYNVSRRIAWYGFAMNLFTILMIMVAIQLPSPVWFENSGAFAAILGTTPRIALAGFVAYHLGSWVDNIIASRTKRYIASKLPADSKHIPGFGFRAIFSSIVGETVDSCIFLPLAFVGVLPLETIPGMILVQIVTKVLIETLVMPILFPIVKSLKNIEGGEYVDPNSISYGIFGGTKKVKN